MPPYQKGALEFAPLKSETSEKSDDFFLGWLRPLARAIAQQSKVIDRRRMENAAPRSWARRRAGGAVCVCFGLFATLVYVYINV